MQSWMCSGTLKLVLDKPDSRNAGPDYQQIDVFPGLPVIFGKSQRCRVCLPELDVHQCVIKAALKPFDYEAMVIVKSVSQILSVSIKGDKSEKSGGFYYYEFIPFDARSIYAIYDFGKSLGEGATGQVNAVRHRRTKNVFAAKKFNYTSASEPLWKNIIRTETIALKAFDHPRVLKLRTYFREAGAIIFILDFAQHGSLGDYIYHNEIGGRVLDQFAAAKAAKQMLAALAHIHGVGYIHCDVKPDNTLVDSWDPLQIKICDFGYIQRIEKQHGFIVGTHPYIAPEVLNGDFWDHKIDSYSLGITVFYLMSARWPYKRFPPQPYLNAHGNRKIKEPVQWDIAWNLLPDVSNLCKDFLMKMAAEDPQSRMGVLDGLMHGWVAAHSS